MTFLKQKSSSLLDKEIEEKVNLRLKYKKERNFKEADKIRGQLQELGIIIEDTKEGKTTWRIS
ncbi:MAG: hypothetical protein L6416_12385 [Candidatus Omnitrophica bacterium]|nr:hypothetical protein [Candidatus Omnitrophota bacterium]